jgi:hypothetical protein
MKASSQMNKDLLDVHPQSVTENEIEIKADHALSRNIDQLGSKQ